MTSESKRTRTWPYQMEWANAKYLLSSLLLIIVAMGSALSAIAFSSAMPASVVIGQVNFVSSKSATGQNGINDPSSLVFDSAGNLWVTDSSNNRVLMYKPPFATHMAASLVLGQTNFVSSKPATTQNGLNYPVGVIFDATGDLWLTDALNHRVLMFKPPFSTGMAASLVIGHKSFSWGGISANQTGFHTPTGIGFDKSGDLWVTDHINSRVLMFKPPFSNGMPASLVIGQPDFKSVGCAANPTSTLLCHPPNLSFDASGNLWVADGGYGRVLMFTPPFSTGMPATLAIGVTGLFVAGGWKNSQLSNQFKMYQPSGLDFDQLGNLWVADRGNNRVLMFKPPFKTGMAASLVIGQPNFSSSGYATSQTRLHGPPNLHFDATGNLWVIDARNNRVLMFSLSFGISPPKPPPRTMTIQNF